MRLYSHTLNMYQIGYKSKLITNRLPKIIIKTADMYELTDKTFITKSFKLYHSPLLIKLKYYLITLLSFHL